MDMHHDSSCAFTTLDGDHSIRGARLRSACLLQLGCSRCITVSYSNLYETFVLEYVLSDCLFCASFYILISHYEISSLFGTDAMQLRHLGTRAA